MKDEIAVIYPNETVSTAVLKYCRERSLPLPPHIERHAELTEKELGDKSEMMVSRLQAQYLLWTARSLGAKKVLEVGCFTGFSALALAEALKGIDGAKIITMDIDPGTGEIARKAFKDAGVDHFVSLVLGPAEKTLPDLVTEGPFDLVFLDANKDGYVTYYNTILELGLLRKDGVLIADNVLKKGLVVNATEINPSITDEYAMSKVPHVKEFNDLLAADKRVETFLLPVFDGLALVRVL
ncbi:hypothetical protein TWF569_004865 [Orbilia oligospora]|uniref:O-methyltransferase n=1 Tax=Orbilia oligospora TaxID=2813651 RepID=A0A7C8NWG2_ORBOL|nr:hypothetical protein TWF102_011104 [Orbilia oligospora]KAF3131779.1 hypothetical protein TWF703_007498 [Orbilia oligospora]KAF3149953.1 hypothetical protein TWF569_004865 [Orbilia oligospora]KAF3153146.1 hypothetical protein TWF594_000183 [Orbilia oligospora]